MISTKKTTDTQHGKHTSVEDTEAYTKSASWSSSSFAHASAQSLRFLITDAFFPPWRSSSGSLQSPDEELSFDEELGTGCS